MPRNIFAMESILDKVLHKMDALEKKIEDYERLSSEVEIQKLEAYYTSCQWKDNLAMDKAGKFPEKLKRGVPSEDVIWNMLEPIKNCWNGSTFSSGCNIR